MKQLLVVLLLTCFAAMDSVAQPDTVQVYDGTIPGAIAASVSPYTILVKGTRRLYNVIHPILTIFHPARPNGIAVIICPGGAYARLSIDHEGELVAQELIKQGITAFVLQYRLPNDNIMTNKSLGPLQDIQTTIQLVRSRATQWQLDPAMIGVMGFSAGGHLAAMAAVHGDSAAGNRPSFAALIYPVISFTSQLTHVASRRNLLGEAPADSTIRFFSADQQVAAGCPPVFLVHAQDDTSVSYQNSVAMYQACLQHAVPSTIKLYPAGGHGFGLNNPTTTDQWLDHFLSWLRKR